VKTLLVILLFLALFQSAVNIPNILLVVLVVRSFISGDKYNYYLAFGFGLVLSFLSGSPLGILSALFLIAVFIMHQMQRSQFSANIWLLGITSFAIFTAVLWLESIMHLVSFRWWPIIIQELAIVPIYVLIRFWEERFVGRPDVRLKIRG
jgi:cell shape-determining protein MreD